MHRVRWKRGEEPEMQCAYCFEFWPIAGGFWDPSHGIQKCECCLREERASRDLRRRKERRSQFGAAADHADNAARYYRRNYSTLARLLKGKAA